MFLRRFHEWFSSIKNKSLSLVWYLIRNKFILFCLLYILFNFLLLEYLRNNFEYMAIGLSFAFPLLLLIFFFQFVLRRRVYETVGRRKENRQAVHSLLTILKLSFLLVGIIFLCTLRLYPFLREEKKYVSMIESFTTNFVCISIKVDEDPKVGNKNTTYYTTVLSDTSEGSYLSSIEILVRLSNFPRIGVGDVCEICGTISEPENFDDFDYKKFLMNKGVYGIMRGNSVDCNFERKRSVRTILYDLKKNLVKRLEKTMVEPQVSLLVGILFGEDRPFNEEFEGYLRNSGTSHIVAASGYNVTILVLLINKIFKFLRKRSRNILSLLTIWSFCLMSGASASIIRATIMGSLVLLASSLGRYQSVHRTFVIGIWLFIFFSPTIVYDVGFQLSIMATLGLIYLAPSIESFLKRKGVKLGEVFKEYILTTMSCTLSTLPVSILTFGSFSSIGILANTLILPVLESTMLWGALGLLFNSISEGISKIFLTISFVQLKYFEIVVTKLGSLDFLTFEINGRTKGIVSGLIVFWVLIFVIKEYEVENESFNYYFRLTRGEDD